MKLRKRNNQSGVALIFVVLTLVLLAAIAATLIMASNTETSVNFNYRSEEQAYYAAHAGVEEVRDRMRQNFGANGLFASLPQTMPGTAGGVLYVINQGTDPNVVQPWTVATPYVDDELCHEGFVVAGMTNLPSGSGTRCSTVPTLANWYVNPAPLSTAPYAGTAGAVPYKWVRVTLKQNCSAGFQGASPSNYCVDNTCLPAYVGGVPNACATTQVCFDAAKEILLAAANCPAMSVAQPPEPVYVITAMAVTPNGARRILQSEVAKVLFPPVPSSLTFAGPNPSFGGPNSMPYHIDGNDQAVPACVPGGNKPAIGGYDQPSVNQIVTGIPNNRLDHYTGSPAYPNSEQNIGSTGANSLGPWGSVSTLTQIVTNIEAQASQTIPSGSSSPPLGNFGTAANPLITVVKGNADLSLGTPGYGVLLVEGNLTLHGLTNFNGIILVIGTGSLTVQGGGGGQINGAVLVANTKTDAAGNPLVGNVPGPPTVNWNGGGGNGIYWNSCDANLLNNTVYFHTIAWHEVSY